jgi:hypothetical protein
LEYNAPADVNDAESFAGVLIDAVGTHGPCLIRTIPAMTAMQITRTTPMARRYVLGIPVAGFFSALLLFLGLMR